jgi:hypothetical protein
MNDLTYQNIQSYSANPKIKELVGDTTGFFIFNRKILSILIYKIIIWQSITDSARNQ